MKRFLARLLSLSPIKFRLILKLIHRLDVNKYLDVVGVRHGSNCRVYDVNFGSEPYLISIGNHVSLGSGTRFITHDGAVWVLRELLSGDEAEKLDFFAPIKIGNNVFIGNDVMILPGVTIGDNVVIGAKSLVSKSLASNAVYGGVPARRLKSIEEYSSKANQCIPTKGLEGKSKKAFLVQCFSCAHGYDLQA